MSKHKWAPGDWAMLPVRVMHHTKGTIRVLLPGHGSHGCCDEGMMRLVDPPGHGPHLDAAKLLYKIGLMRGSALCWCDNMHRQGYLESLDAMTAEIKRAIAAQGADDER
jgi:hypothetical protein